MVPPIENLIVVSKRVLSQIPSWPFDQNFRCAIYGAGFLGTWAVKWLMEQKINIVACFDSDPSKHGKQICGVEIHPPEAICQINPDFVFITARSDIKPIELFLISNKLPWCLFEAVYVAINMHRYEHVHNLLFCDKRSRETLRGVLFAKITGELEYCQEIYTGNQYFCLPPFCGRENETYVDAGAYTGDTVERFIWQNNGVFNAIYAFEPAPAQFAALVKRKERLVQEWALTEDSIRVEQTALSDQEINMIPVAPSNELPNTVLVPKNSGAIKTIKLDDFLRTKKVTLIKADIEGMELSMLKGAKRIISLWKPKLAICVYHYPNDLLDIIQYLQHLVPQYKFALRHHSPRQLETVLYAWTP